MEIDLFHQPKNLLEPTSTNIFFKGFDNTLTKGKIKTKRFRKLMKEIATETDNVLLTGNLENNCSKTFL